MSIISALIPTYNAGLEIDNLINQLLNQKLDEHKLEIIVVDSSSTDGTVTRLKENFPSVKLKVIPNQSFNHGGTRNYLASLASGDFLLFLTQDAIAYNEKLVLNLLSGFKDQKTAIVYARQIPKNGAAPLEVFARQFNYPTETAIKTKNDLDHLGVKTFFNSNVCSMYKRQVFDSFGGFPENIIMNEDMIFAAQAILNDYSIIYQSEAIVLHSHNYNLKQQFKRYFDIGMFFQEMSYLREYASNEKEGFRMVFDQMSYLCKKGKAYLIPKAFIETVVKYVAYQLGMKHQALSPQFKKKLSAYMK
jgi:rhamnosyltransferase